MDAVMWILAMIPLLLLMLFEGGGNNGNDTL